MIRRSRLRKSALTFACAGLGPCAGAPRVVPLTPAPIFKPRQQVEVWGGDQTTTLHAVRVVEDEVTGVAYWKPVDCDSCRVSIPLEGVDSIRAVAGERSAIVVVASAVAAAAVVLIVWRASEGD